MSVDRADWPWLGLVGLALLAPAIVVTQGGGWHVALFSCPATLLTPVLAIAAMLNLARLAESLGGR